MKPLFVLLTLLAACKTEEVPRTVTLYLEQEERCFLVHAEMTSLTTSLKMIEQSACPKPPVSGLSLTRFLELLPRPAPVPAEAPLPEESHESQ